MGNFALVKQEIVVPVYYNDRTIEKIEVHVVLQRRNEGIYAGYANCTAEFYSCVKHE